MGLIKAIKGAVGGVLGDQWKEYFYCEAMPSDVLMVKGVKRATGRGSNKGSDNIITNGSVLAVADGQCAVIVEQGRVVDLCAEPGEYTYDTTVEPSIFSGSLSESIPAVFANIGKRFTFGGDAAADQRIYYINTREMVGNKYGTPSPVPFRVVDQRAGIDIDIGIRCFGEYSYRVTNPILLYTNVMGNVRDSYTRGELEGQMKTELLTALQPAFARISEQGVRYSALPGHTQELADALNEVLSDKWRDLRGIEIVSVGVSSVKASEEDEAMIKEMQRTAAYTNSTLADAYKITATGEAMKTAAGNAAGAAVGFMGMNMATGMGGFNAIPRQEPQAPQAPAGGWTCACGAVNTGKFCSQCGGKKPESAGSWTCACGTVNTGKFCSECGAKRPEAGRCPHCGAAVTGKFCPECGQRVNG
ncbi:MAG: SPFH domain-containing protein [Oscillospiraceae bacterium]|nr:SPFH domain-containing protein [Oscillospiraceae bacterium]